MGRKSDFEGLRSFGLFYLSYVNNNDNNNFRTYLQKK